MVRVHPITVFILSTSPMFSSLTSMCHSTWYLLPKPHQDIYRAVLILTWAQCWHGALQKRSGSCKPTTSHKNTSVAPASLLTCSTVHIKRSFLPRERDLQLSSVKFSKQWLLLDRMKGLVCGRVLISTRLK